MLLLIFKVIKWNLSCGLPFLLLFIFYFYNFTLFSFIFFVYAQLNLGFFFLLETGFSFYYYLSFNISHFLIFIYNYIVYFFTNFFLIILSLIMVIIRLISIIIIIGNYIFQDIYYFLKNDMLISSGYGNLAIFRLLIALNTIDSINSFLIFFFPLPTLVYFYTFFYDNLCFFSLFIYLFIDWGVDFISINFYNLNYKKVFCSFDNFYNLLLLKLLITYEEQFQFYSSLNILYFYFCKVGVFFSTILKVLLLLFLLFVKMCSSFIFDFKDYIFRSNRVIDLMSLDHFIYYQMLIQDIFSGNFNFAKFEYSKKIYFKYNVPNVDALLYSPRKGYNKKLKMSNEFFNDCYSYNEFYGLKDSWYQNSVKKETSNLSSLLHSDLKLNLNLNQYYKDSLGQTLYLNHFGLTTKRGVWGFLNEINYWLVNYKFNFTAKHREQDSFPELEPLRTKLFGTAYNDLYKQYLSTVMTNFLGTYNDSKKSCKLATYMAHNFAMPYFIVTHVDKDFLDEDEREDFFFLVYPIYSGSVGQLFQALVDFGLTTEHLVNRVSFINFYYNIFNLFEYYNTIDFVGYNYGPLVHIDHDGLVNKRFKTFYNFVKNGFNYNSFYSVSSNYLVLDPMLADLQVLSFSDLYTKIFNFVDKSLAVTKSNFIAYRASVFPSTMGFQKSALYYSLKHPQTMLSSCFNLYLSIPLKYKTEDKYLLKALNLFENEKISQLDTLAYFDYLLKTNKHKLWSIFSIEYSKFVQTLIKGVSNNITFLRENGFFDLRPLFISDKFKIKMDTKNVLLKSGIISSDFSESKNFNKLKLKLNYILNDKSLTLNRKFFLNYRFNSAVSIPFLLNQQELDNKSYFFNLKEPKNLSLFDFWNSHFAFRFVSAFLYNDIFSFLQNSIVEFKLNLLLKDLKVFVLFFFEKVFYNILFNFDSFYIDKVNKFTVNYISTYYRLLMFLNDISQIDLLFLLKYMISQYVLIIILDINLEYIFSFIYIFSFFFISIYLMFNFNRYIDFEKRKDYFWGFIFFYLKIIKILLNKIVSGVAFFLKIIKRTFHVFF